MVVVTSWLGMMLCVSTAGAAADGSNQKKQGYDACSNDADDRPLIHLATMHSGVESIQKRG